MSRKRKKRTPHRRPEADKTASAGPAAPVGEARRAGVLRVLAPCGLIALVLIAYANALTVPFVYDDYGSIVENPSVHWRELSIENARDALLRSTTRRVIANWSFGLNHWLSGLEPRAFHATNVALHVVTVLLVYALLLGLLRGRVRDRNGDHDRQVLLAALIGTGVFAVHPLGTQAVTYVVQRMAGMAALFCVASLLLYVRGRARSGWGRVAWWGGSALAWGLALGSKESAATFPVIIALYEWLLHRGADRRSALQLAGVVAVAGLVSFGVMRFYYTDPFRDTFYHDFTLGERLLSQPRVLVYYASLIAWPDPSRLSLMHDFAPSRGVFSPWTTLPALAALIATVVWALRAVERRPLAVFALGWCGVALAVETSVFPLRLAHEHRLYLPLVGVAIALGAGARVGLARRPKWVLVVAGLVIGSLTFATHVRNRVWQERASVWADVVEKSPGEGIAYANLAALAVDAGRYEEAFDWLERGGAAAPGYPGIPRGLGAIHSARGDHERALPFLLDAIALDPLDHAAIGQVGIELLLIGRADEALRYFRESTRIFEHPLIVHQHGVALARLHRFDEAIIKQQRAIDLSPDDGHAHVALGAALTAVGRRVEARRVLGRALQLDDPLGARVELAGLAWVSGEPVAAISHLREALGSGPESLTALNNLAWMLATVADPALRDGAEALALIARAEALESEPDAESMDTRAAAEAAAGEFARALSTAVRAAALARANGDARLAREIELRAEQYRAGRSYLDPISRGTAP